MQKILIAVGIFVILLFVANWLDMLFNAQPPSIGCNANEIKTQNGCIPIPIKALEKQIVLIQKKMANSPIISVTSQLDEAQNKIKAIYELINQHPDMPDAIAFQTKMAVHQEQIEQIYSSLSDKLQMQIEDIEAQISKSNKPCLLAPKFDILKKQIVAIQQTMSQNIENPAITALQNQVAKQQSKIVRLNVIICVDKQVPQCLSLIDIQDIQKKLPMFFVPAMQAQSIPKSLQVWIKTATNTQISQAAFFIMRREVTVGEFKTYFKTLDKIQQEKLDFALKTQFSAAPVASVPWWAAKGYADWLSEQSGCQLHLPTYSQWVAATISYANPKTAVIRDTHFDLGQGAKPRQENKASSNILQPHVLDLLGNLREWSSDNSSSYNQTQCFKGSYYLLGEDYKTWQDNIIGEPICESATLDTVGFRLVLSE